jgi:hypothetical protein
VVAMTDLATRARELRAESERLLSGDLPAPVAPPAPAPAAGEVQRIAERAAWRVLNKWLDHLKGKTGGFLTGDTLDLLLPKIAQRMVAALAVRDDRIAELERRVAELEAESRGGGA